MIQRLLHSLFLSLALLLPLSAAQAQGLDIGLVVGNESALPITVVPMPYQGSGTAPDTDVAGVIRADLNRSGQFRSLAEASNAQASHSRQRVRSPPR